VSDSNFINNFIFFHVKKKNSSTEFILHEHDDQNFHYFVSSIKKYHPESKILQCTDLETPKITGVDEVFRIDVNQNKIMEARMLSYSKLNISEPSVYLDTDMLILRKLPYNLLHDKAEVILLSRSFNKDKFVPEKFRGQIYKKHNNGTLGEIYPFIGCFTISKSNDFWKTCYEMYKKLDVNYKFWFGDQKILKQIVETKKFDIAFLQESDFACPPSFISNNKTPFILHFKGKVSKKLIKKYYDYIAI
jgi:hypothetical protein